MEQVEDDRDSVYSKKDDSKRYAVKKLVHMVRTFYVTAGSPEDAEDRANTSDCDDFDDTEPEDVCTLSVEEDEND